MSLLRLMFAVLVLLAQVWPLQAHEAAACDTGCCAWLAEAGLTTCVCADEASPAAPANLPPAGSRELVPSVVWVPVAEVIPTVLVEDDMDAAVWEQYSENANRQAGVRLLVLFCSFLN